MTKYPSPPAKIKSKLCSIYDGHSVRDLLDMCNKQFPSIDLSKIKVEVEYYSAPSADLYLLYEYDNPDYEVQYQQYLKDMIAYLEWRKQSETPKAIDEQIEKIRKELE